MNQENNNYNSKFLNSSSSSSSSSSLSSLKKLIKEKTGKDLSTKDVEKIKKELKIEKGTGFSNVKMEKQLDKILAKTPLTKKDEKGKEMVEGKEMIIFKKEDEVEYLFEAIYLEKLIRGVPKMAVSQWKNIHLLMSLVGIQQFGKENKKARATFTLEEYIKLREGNLSKSGKRFQEYMTDLHSGARTIFRVPYEKRGERRIIINSVYGLDFPEKRGGKYEIRFNAFFDDMVLEVLEGKAKQFFTFHLKEIADRETTNKPYLHQFYKKLISSKRTGKTDSVFIRIDKLLERMYVIERYKGRPKECFRIFKDCLIHFLTNYPELLKDVAFKKYVKDEKSLWASSLKNLKDIGYEDFNKKLLDEIDVNDFREALVSFEYTPEKPKKQKEYATSNKEVLIDEFLEWEKNHPPMAQFPEEKKKKFLNDCIRQLGQKEMEDILEEIETSTRPSSGYNLFVVLLPEEIRNNKVVVPEYTKKRNPYLPYEEAKKNWGKTKKKWNEI